MPSLIPMRSHARLPWMQSKREQRSRDASHLSRSTRQYECVDHSQSKQRCLAGVLHIPFVQRATTAIILLFGCCLWHRWMCHRYVLLSVCARVVMTFRHTFSGGGFRAATTTSFRSTRSYVMNGPFMTLLFNRRPYSPAEAIQSLKRDLLSDDIERARFAAAAVRSSYEIRDRARRAGTQIIVMIDGQVCSLDPDSPLLPDLAPLAGLVVAMFPLDASEEPVGLLEAAAVPVRA